MIPGGCLVANIKLFENITIFKEYEEPSCHRSFQPMPNHVFRDSQAS